MTGAKIIMHTDEEIERAAKLAQEFDPSGVAMDDTTDLRTLAEAVDGVRTGEARVRELVARARANGRSWGEVGIALGVSRQAARERFAEKIRA
jgi:1-deoxy-D-xylulose 5-phosphate reductoisomerase